MKKIAKIGERFDCHDSFPQLFKNACGYVEIVTLATSGKTLGNFEGIKSQSFGRLLFGVGLCVIHTSKLKRIAYRCKRYFNFLLTRRMLLVLLMDEAADSTAPIEKAKNGREVFTEKIAEEIISACGSGFTLEKAGALVGVNPSTIRTWSQRKPDFGKRVETARKKHELSLLRDVQLAGEKSWQAKAWILERGYNWAQPSARLNVTQEHTHGISSNLASLLAGIAGRKKEKKAEVINIESPKNKVDTIFYCATSAGNVIDTTSTCAEISKPIISPCKQTLPKPRHKRMKLRKPRAESLAKYPPTTTLPADPPTAI